MSTALVLPQSGANLARGEKALTVTSRFISEECLEIIEQARHEESPDIKENLEEDSESSDDDSEVRERSREASRLAAEGQLPRNRRTRTLTEKGRFFHSL